MTLADGERAFLAAARRATLATISPDGRPRLVPICHVVIDDVVWTPIDEKPKTVANPMSLARVRDILARPEVTLLVDRWSEDWAALAWVRLDGRAAIVPAGAAPLGIIEKLRMKYPQYVDHDLEHRPLIAVTIEHATSWSATTRRSRPTTTPRSRSRREPRTRR